MYQEEKEGNSNNKPQPIKETRKKNNQITKTRNNYTPIQLHPSYHNGAGKINRT